MNGQIVIGTPEGKKELEEASLNGRAISECTLMT
jgi:hypothetical protein